MATNIDFIVKNGVKAGVNTGVNLNGGAPANSLVLDSSGNIGIGTASPTTRLQIGDATVNANNILKFGKSVTASQSTLPYISQVSEQSAGVTNDLMIFAGGSGGGRVIVDSNDFVVKSGGGTTPSGTERVRVLADGSVTFTGTVSNHILVNSSFAGGAYTVLRNTATTGVQLSAGLKLEAYNGSAVSILGYTAVTGSTYVVGAVPALSHVTWSEGSGGIALIANAVSSGIKFFTNGNSAANLRMTIDASGQLGIGVTPSAGRSLTVGKNITGATSAFGIVSNGTIQSDVTVSYANYVSAINTQAATFTVPTVIGYSAQQNALGANSAITNQYGFYADSTLIGGTNNYGFSGNIASATGRWNLYMAGTAQNYILGNVGIGSGKTVPATALDVNGTVTATAFSGPLTGTVTGAASLNVLKAGDTMSGDLNITKASGTPKLAIQSAQAAGFAPGQIQLWRYGAGGTATPNAQTLGELRFDGLNTAAAYSNVGMISVVSGTNTATGTPGSMTFSTSDGTSASAATRMTLDASGNLGVGGTASGGRRIHAKDGNCAVTSEGTAGYGSFYATSSGTNPSYHFFGSAGVETARITAQSDNVMVFSNTSSATGRVWIDASGNVGVGQSSNGNLFEITKNQNAATVAVIRNTDAGTGATTVLQLTGGTKYVNFSVVPNNGNYLAIQGAGGIVTKFEDFDSHNWRNNLGTTTAFLDSTGNFLARAAVRARGATTTDGYVGLTTGNATNSGYIEFYSHTGSVRQAYIGFSTTNAAINAGTLPYVAGLHAFSGAITVATSGSSGSVHITDTGAGGANIRLTGNGATTPSKYIRAAGGVFQILNNAYTTAILEVSDAGAVSAVSFNATSTERVKDAITDLSDSYLAKFAELRPREYDRKDYSAHEFGFIAEEMAEVYPEVVGRDSDGKPSGIDYGKLSTILTAKVQEQQTVIEQLQNQMARVMELLKGSF